MATPAQLQAAVAANNPGRNWNQLCQAFVWQAIKAVVGAPKVIYSSARAARLASTIVSTDMNAAPPGAIHYWLLGTADHVAISLGDGICVYATSKGDTIASWGTNLKVSHASSYPAKYVGWSRTNGANQAIPVSAWNAPAALTPTQRKVLASGKSNRRSGPGVNFPESGAELPANTVGNFIGWAYGPVNAQETLGVWFKGISGSWFAAVGFTDQGIHELADLNPAAPPIVVVPVAEPDPEPVPDPVEPNPELPVEPVPTDPVEPDPEPDIPPVPEGPTEPDKPAPPLVVPAAIKPVTWWQIAIGAVITAAIALWLALTGTLS